MVLHWLRKPKAILFTPLWLALALAIACGAGAPPTAVPPTATPTPRAIPQAEEGPIPTATRAPAAASTPRATPTAAPPPPAGTPVAERLKVAMTPPAHQTTVSWLSARSSTGQTSAIYEALITLNEFTGALEPMLATDWDLSKDGMTFHVRLREGIPFHNGKEFTAKDVVFTWERVTSQESVHSNATPWRELIKSKDDLEIINNHEMVYHLALPGVLIPFFSSNIQGGMPIFSKDHWDAVGGTTKGYVDNPVGTGPFRFVEFKEGQYILFQRLEQHWRKVPDFKELQIFYVPESTTRLAQLLAEEVHISEIDRTHKSSVLDRGLKVEPGTLPGIQVAILFGGTHLPDKRVEGPLSNPLVRQALNLAFDRRKIQATIFGGDGELQEAWSVHRTDEAFNPEWQVYPYDPVKAKELLAQAGYPNGFRMELWAAVFPGAPELPQVAEATATMWKEIGVSVTIVESEFASLRSRYQTRSFTGTQAWTMRGSTTPCFRACQGSFVSPAANGGPLFAFEDPFLDDRQKKFEQLVDPGLRRDLLREIGDFTYRNYATVPLLWLSGLAGVNPKVVVEYKCNTEVFGPVRCHEYTQAVRK